MRQVRNVLLLAAVLLALTAFPMFLYADGAAQADPSNSALPPIDQVGHDYEFPPLQEASPYPYPIISYEAPDQAGRAATGVSETLTIDVWYGDNQTFGVRGTPQEWINILGNVSGPSPIQSLTYTLNSGDPIMLSVGATDKMRLYRPGDFNIELDYRDLNDGLNTVVITAFDGSNTVYKTVTVQYSADIHPALPFNVNWGAAGAQNVLAGGHPVDGQWDIVSGQLINLWPGYDRLYAIGDMAWKDYEVTVPVTVDSINIAGWGNPSNGAAVGMIVRWQGHTQGTPPSQPALNWRRVGAIAWYRWVPPAGDASFQMLGYGGGQIAKVPAAGAIQLSKTYNFKVSVKSGAPGERATYRFKYWEQGTAEPVGWFIAARGNVGEPANGSVALAAHQVMARFGEVSVKPIPADATFKITKTASPNGQIIITPDKTEYKYGETVEIRVQGDAGYGLKNWTGDFSGADNPIVFDITRNVTVGAAMKTITQQPTLDVNLEGEGVVGVVPDKRPSGYLYGEAVTLTAQAKPGYKFAGWGGDLTGLVNPARIVMDRSKSITANFVLSNAGSPISDDFHSCVLNANLWTFINPLGDGSYEMNGTQLLLKVPSGIAHNPWTGGNNSIRVMQPTQNGNFEVVAKYESLVNRRYQMQGILVEQDAQNYLRFETHYDGTKVIAYAASFVNGNPTERISKSIPAGTPPFLRVTRPGNQWVLSYSFDGQSWEQAGDFQHVLSVTRSGVFAGNQVDASGTAPAHTAVVDYFFNTASPIDPEDGGGTGGFEIATSVVGEGTISLTPQSPYACGQTVTVSAVPAPGWTFSGWSGDLSGFNPSQSLVVSGDHNVAATFVKEAPTKFSIYLPMNIKYLR